MGTNSKAVTPASTESKMEAVMNDKPLSATQLKNLERIVEGDFADLHDKVAVTLSNRYSEKHDEIVAKYDVIGAQIDEAVKELNDFVAKVNADLHDSAVQFIEGVKAKYPGLQFPTTVINGSLSATAVSGRNSDRPGANAITIEGKAEELSKAKAAYGRLISTATTLINAEHRKVQRQVLLQGVSSLGAQELINDLPNYADILSLVQTELQVDRQGDLDLLMPKLDEES